jgi:hypothetical protein
VTIFPGRYAIINHNHFWKGLGCFILWLNMASSVQANPVEFENHKAGTSGWQLWKPATNGEIEGYASLTSVNRGGRILLYVSTQESAYRMDVYRTGWYGGAGGRLVQGGILRKGIRQPMPVVDPTTGLIECNWKNPYPLRIGDSQDRSNWVSGIYLVKLTALSSGAQSYIIFVVRDDDRHSEYLFQSSVTTYQAYNNWGGKSLYGFNSNEEPAKKVSFNRPYEKSANPAAAHGVGAGDFLTNNAVPPTNPGSPAGWEYNMVRWLEREGYDVTYITNIDTHARRDLFKGHKAWLSVGHDEYWTWEMRTHVEQAREQGAGLAFFSANVCYWQIRLERSSITKKPNRTIVSYKDDAFKEDPYARDDDPHNNNRITTRWREAPANRPEESLVGVMYEGNPVDADIVITNPTHWSMSGTELRVGDRLPGLLGYEADRRVGSTPPGMEILSESPFLYEGRQHVANMSCYATPRGGHVFAVGSIQWSWALDDYNVPTLRASRLNDAAQQVTRNVLARLLGDVFPIPKIDAPRIATKATAVKLSAEGSSDADGRIVEHRWDFGNGRIELGETVVHTFETTGKHEVSLIVRDDRGATSSTTAVVEVTE